MKRNYKILSKYLLVGLGGYFSLTNVYAATSSAPISQSTMGHTSIVTPSDSSGFSIDAGSPLSVSLLDNCWKNRETLANQNVIANYLMTQPQVPSDYEIAWKTARLVYFIGNYGIGEAKFLNTNDGVTLFNYGVTAGSLAKQLKPNGVEGNYWYAIDLGSYGLAKGVLASARNAKYGMAALRIVQVVDPSYQNYGSSRVLGRYYQELPSVFGGDTAKAAKLIGDAVKSSPKFDNNWVFLGQYYLSNSQYQEALDACNKALSLPGVDGKFEDMRYKKEARQCVNKAQSKIG